MLRGAAFAAALILLGSCNRSESGDAIGPLVGAAGSSKASGSGGFSADLAKELGAGSAAKAGGMTGSDGKAGADPRSSGDSKSGSDTRAGGNASAMAGEPTAAGDASAIVAGGPPAASGTKAGAPGGDAKASDPKAAGDAKVGDAKAGDTKAGDAKAKAGDGRQSAPGAKTAAAVSNAGSGSTAVASVADRGPDPERRNGTPSNATGAHGPVKVSAALAAIKLSLLPNWDRDVDEAGTFQYVVRIKGTQSTKTFTFRYGYDDPKAPVDHDQYKKYLQDTRTLTGEIKDRQRGAAWFLEGNDAAGMPAFRYVVLYGGKRLICYGSLYKDVDSNRLGDDRDQTLIQAKQICETLAL